MIEAITHTHLPGLPLIRRGKVRDTYDLGDSLLMIATDRLSAFDVVLPTPIPGKGVLLTGLSGFWFNQTAGLVPNHLITTDIKQMPPEVEPFAKQLAGRTMVVKRADRIDVECVVRGYLAGSAWEQYRQEGTVAEEEMPAGLKIGDKLPEPLFTPAVKVDEGHDVNVSRRDLANQYGRELVDRLELASLNVYLAASELAEQRQMILADTKFEFGYVNGELTLIDELLTPDSSRYWDAALWQPGREPASFDKQFVRDWLAASGWDKQPPGPQLPNEVVQGTRERYVEAYRRLAGRVPEPFGQGNVTEIEQGPPNGHHPQGVGGWWRVSVTVLPKAGVNDPEGDAILGGLHSLGFDAVRQVRAGRLFVVDVPAGSADAAAAAATSMAERLLANPVIQQFEIEQVEPLERGR